MTLPRMTLALALSICAACALVLWTALMPLERSLSSDAVEYLGLARSLARDGDFISYFHPPLPELYRTPGYPALLALLGAFESEWRLRLVLIVQAFCVLAMGALLLRRARVDTSGEPRRVVELPALLLVTSPIIWLSTSSAATETLFALLLFLAAFSLGRSRDRTTWLIAGGLLGAAALVRPAAMVLIPVGAALLFWLRASLGVSRRRVAAWMIAALLFPALWTLHNGVRHGYWGLSKTVVSYASSVYGLSPLMRGTPDLKTSFYDRHENLGETTRDVLNGLRERPLEAVASFGSGVAKVGLGLGEWAMRRAFAGDTGDRFGNAVSLDRPSIVRGDDGLEFHADLSTPRVAPKAASALLLAWSAVSTIAIYWAAAVGARAGHETLRSSALRSSAPRPLLPGVFVSALVALAWSVALLLASAGPMANSRFRVPFVPLLLLAACAAPGAPSKLAPRRPDPSPGARSTREETP